MRRPARATASFIGLFFALSALPRAGSADVVLDLSLAEMTDAAEAVVHGRVLSVDAAWDDSHRRIFTTVVIEVEAYLSGQGPSTVTIRQVGGRVGDTTLFVAGQPRFAHGEEVVVFLESDGSGEPSRYVVVCMAAGKFTVSFDATTGERVVGQDLRGLNRVPASGRRAVARQRIARPFHFTELVDIVTRAATSGGAR